MIFVKYKGKWCKSLHYVNTSDKVTKSNSVINQWVFESNSWKKVYSYRWALSDWSGCSKTCGTGTQTKTYECIREDGSISKTKHKDGTTSGSKVSNTYCTRSGLAIPSGSTIERNCNTHSCTVTIYYSLWGDDQWNFYRMSKTKNELIGINSSCTNCGGKSGSFNVHYDDFPIRLIFVTHNWDNGGGPGAGPWVRVNNGTSRVIQPCSGHTDGHWDCNAAVSFELNYNSTIKKLNAGSSCVSGCLQNNGYKMTNKDPWYGTRTLTSL